MGQKLFPLGAVYPTRKVLEALAKTKMHQHELLRRHMAGDWGDLPEADKQANLCALQQGKPVYSRYTLATGEVLWVFTEGDRSSTTLLLDQELE